MKVKIVEFTEGAKNAEGVAVIIDVFRAFSVVCYAFDSGAVRIIATQSIEEAFNLKYKYIKSVLIGERDEKKIEGFDLGNSPTEILKSDLRGKTIIHTTTAGTSGLVNASKAERVITGSLVNAGAIIRYIKSIKPENVTLVAMGYRASISTEEDLLCARIIKAGLTNKKYSYEKEISGLINSSGKRFFNPDNLDFSPPTDFFLCTMINKFDFVLRGEKRIDGNVDLMRIDI
jgi:2-phosphosulfolactate phosphatase